MDGNEALDVAAGWCGRGCRVQGYNTFSGTFFGYILQTGLIFKRRICWQRISPFPKISTFFQNLRNPPKKYPVMRCLHHASWMLLNASSAGFLHRTFFTTSHFRLLPFSLLLSAGCPVGCVRPGMSQRGAGLHLFIHHRHYLQCHKNRCSER